MNQLQLSLSENALLSYLVKQLNSFFPDEDIIEAADISNCLSQSLERIKICFNAIHLPYFNKDGMPYFNHLHGDHYAMFLYLMSHTAYKENKINIASKLFFLNKMLFGIDAFYGITLPERFLFVHPIGTILGRAKYEDYFVVYQGVTIGATTEGVYPDFSKSTILYSNSSVIGRCSIGSNCVLGAKASLINVNIPDNSIVVGNYPGYKVLSNSSNLIKSYFNI
jgi:serine O-acetyltransferase